MCDSQEIKIKEVKIPVPWGHIAGKFYTSCKLCKSFDKWLKRDDNMAAYQYHAYFTWNQVYEHAYSEFFNIREADLSCMYHELEIYVHETIYLKIMKSTFIR